MFSPTEKPDVTSTTRDLFVRALNCCRLVDLMLTTFSQENLSLKPSPTPAPVSKPTPSFAPLQSNGVRLVPDASNSRGPASRSRPPRDRPSGRPARSRPEDPFDIFADPPSSSKALAAKPREKTAHRPRRNSESSVMERASKFFDDDDDRRRRERRNRDRDSRHRDGKPRSSRKDRRLDIIDKLDVTSIYGTGSELHLAFFFNLLHNTNQERIVFHHDGPFDACNPHRNRKGLRATPMQAFPKGSSNMALGGAGPNNSNIDLNLFHGRGTEGYNDFNSGVQRNPDTVSFDAGSLIDPIHGAESMGLGTSTFLDGAPASRSAIARRESENEAQTAQSGGLQRKKSLAQRLRGRSGTGRVVSPTEPHFASSGLAPVRSSHSASSRGNERNPFFQEDGEEWDKKGLRIQESRLGYEGGRLRSSSSPKQSTGLERRATNDRGYDEPKLNAGGGGLLNRMKSLRKRPERRTSD